MSEEELIEKMSRAIVQSFFDIGHNIYYENPETLRTVSLATKTALNVCRPIIEEPLRAENKKLREELAEYKRNGIVDVTGSMNYHSGYDDGAREERQRCARIAEQARDDTCDGPVAWSMADVIAVSIRESGDE